MQKSRTEFVLRVLAFLLLIIAVLLWFVADAIDSERVRSLVSGISADIGLITVGYLIVSLALDSRELSPEAASRRELIREITRRVRRAPEIEGVYARITDTPYGEYFADADHVQIAGRWFNETFSRHPGEIADFFSRGGRLDLTLLDPTSEPVMSVAAIQYSGPRGETEQAVHVADTKVRSTVDEVAAACRAADADFFEQVTIRFFPGHMNYWAMRFFSTKRDILVSAAFDTFRIQASAYPSTVYDLHQSPSTEQFWVAEREYFSRTSRELARWCRDEIEAHLGSDSALRVFLRREELEDHLRSLGLERVSEKTWEGNTGSCEVTRADDVSLHLMFLSREMAGKEPT